MKSAIYIEDGLVQVVLTPETAGEKLALNLIGEKGVARLYRGQFYDCRGGWTRHAERPQFQSQFSAVQNVDESLIVVVRQAEGAGDEGG